MKGGGLPSITWSTALVLCTCAFLAGRFTVHVSPEIRNRPLEATVSGSAQPAAFRALRGSFPQQADAAALAGVDVLDAGSEQALLAASGLLQLRPPIPAGASGDSFLHVIPFQILSWYPRVVVYPAFVDPARCATIIRLANRTMLPSSLGYRSGEHADKEQQTRTSTGAGLAVGDDPSGTLRWLEARIAAVSRIKADHGESFSVLRYQQGQHYDSHYDTFDPKLYPHALSRRIVTVLTYLAVAEEGGETVFKREGQNGADRGVSDWRSCDDGSYKYTPRQGDALMFWAVKTNGDIDQHALHGGCPVKKGEKWVATKWLHDVPVRKE